MRQLVVVSGKGGTGKTTVVAALAALAPDPVLVDCDVDAPDLHLLIHPEVGSREDFHGLKLAAIDGEACTSCGLCVETCRFGAIDEAIAVDQAACEGCGACTLVCPVEAVRLVDRVSGEVFSSRTRFGPMVHARLRAGEEASGKLVSAVRTKAEQVAKETGRELLMIDGPPGVGCPVIAAISGVDVVLVIAEPTPSGRQGLRRAVETAHHFGIKTYAVVNRADLYLREADAIEDWCRERGVEVLRRLPYDTMATEAMMGARTVVEHGNGPLAQALRGLWGELTGIMGIEGSEEGT